MKSFTKPTNLNGTELRDELRNAGVEISDNLNAVFDIDGILFLDIADKDEAITKTVVANHDGNIIPKEPTIEDKLASVGLSLSDLKSALGLE